MTNTATERLIEYVKQHPCLYDSSHKEYKNVATKNEIWEAIGKEFNSTGDIIKNKWKTLRDGYTKNKKQLKENASIKTYTWAPQLAFLENYLQKFSTIEMPSSSPTSYEFDPFASVDNQTPIEKELPQEDTESMEDSMQFNSSIGTKKPAKRKISEDEDDITRIINFLAKKKKKDDAISHLFLSYAETFRKFPANEQISLKVELAKIFSNVELTLMDNVGRNQYILSTDVHQNSLKTEYEEINLPQVSVKVEPEDRCNEYGYEELAKRLQEKEHELIKVNEQLLSLNKELETLRTRNSSLETRNASLESAVDDLKMRLNNLF